MYGHAADGDFKEQELANAAWAFTSMSKAVGSVISSGCPKARARPWNSSREMVRSATLPSVVGYGVSASEMDASPLKSSPT